MRLSAADQLAEDLRRLPRAPGYRVVLERHHAEGARRRYRGTYAETRAPRDGDDVRVLLVDVTDEGTGEAVADHVWLDLVVLARAKPDAERPIARGDVLSFNARAVLYVKGHARFEGRAIDFKLASPTHVRRISARDPAQHGPPGASNGGPLAEAAERSRLPFCAMLCHNQDMSQAHIASAPLPVAPPRRPPAPQGVIAPDEVVAAVAALVRDEGETAAVARLRMGRQTLCRILARMPVRLGTIELVRARAGVVSPAVPARVQQPAPPDTSESWRLRSGAPAPKPLWERDGVVPTKGPAPAPGAASAPEEPDVSMPDGFLNGLVGGIGAGAEAAVKPEPPADVAAVYRAEFKAARGEEPPFGPPEEAAVSKLLDALDGDADRACRVVRAAYADPFWRPKATIRMIADDPARFSNRNPSRVAAPGRARGTPVQRGPIDYAASAQTAAKVREGGAQPDPDALF